MTDKNLSVTSVSHQLLSCCTRVYLRAIGVAIMRSMVPVVPCSTFGRTLFAYMDSVVFTFECPSLRATKISRYHRYRKARIPQCFHRYATVYLISSLLNRII